ncbi:MAG: D-tyrosyl-tRNA(Tyr) deacylase [Gammaproteobacteria bacterium]|nr:MAG: D-tyrosyl-tRNA(Tyr) deacylase [Gammaproteobacteria bacterium]RTZ68637.1 MAG: D-tyrosyl-tRNA(Tyr) deacylase [Aquificaceae bacterium]
MIALIQRVEFSKVEVEGKVVGQIGKGVNVLLGVEKGDGEEDIKLVADKLVNLRIFPSEDGKKEFDRSLEDIKGEILVVSQFTLPASLRKGRRPSFDRSENPERAKEIYEKFVQYLREKGFKVETGIFGADMKVYILNDGPVTFILRSEDLKKPRKVK